VTISCYRSSARVAAGTLRSVSADSLATTASSLVGVVQCRADGSGLKLWHPVVLAYLIGGGVGVGSAAGHAGRCPAQAIGGDLDAVRAIWRCFALLAFWPIGALRKSECVRHLLSKGRKEGFSFTIFPAGLFWLHALVRSGMAAPAACLCGLDGIAGWSRAGLPRYPLYCMPCQPGLFKAIIRQRLRGQ